MRRPGAVRLMLALIVALGALLLGVSAGTAAATTVSDAEALGVPPVSGAVTDRALAIGLDGDLGAQCDALVTDEMRAGLMSWGQTLAGAERGAVAHLDGEHVGLFCTSEAVSFSIVPMPAEELEAYATLLESNFWSHDGEQYVIGGRMYADRAVIAEGMLFTTHRWHGENQVYTMGPDFTAVELRDAYLALAGGSTGGAGSAGAGDGADEGGALTCADIAPTGRLDRVNGADITLDERASVLQLGDESIELEGLGCQVRVEGCLDGCTDAFGYAEISADQRARFEQVLIDQGSVATPTDAGGVTYALDHEFISATFVDRFDDGRWYYDYATDPRVNEVRDNLLAELAARESDDEVPAEVAPVAETPFDADRPSVLSTLTTLQSVGMPPAAAAATGTLTLVFAALVGLPGLLIEQVVSDAPDRRAGTRRFALAGLWARIRSSIDRAPAWLTVAAGIIVASAVATGVEPDAGFNGGTARLFFSFAATFVVDGLIGLLVAAAVLRRTGASPSIGLRLGSIVIVIVAVVVTRLTGFEPGLVFGLVLALQLAVPPNDRQERAGTGAELATTFGVGIVAWLGYSLATGLVGDEPGAFALFVVEALGGITVGALAALPLVLLPLPAMPGRVVWRASKPVWFGAFAVAMAAFLVIVMRVPAAWDHVEMPLAVWSAMFAVYALVAVAVWVVVVVRRRRRAAVVPETSDEGPEPVLETASRDR